jgi:hypothetical protein
MAAKFHSAALALVIAATAATPIVRPALAQQVGTATAVNPTSEGTPPGGTTTTLTIGARVLHKEHIHTSPTGSLQLLFLDKSTLSIAPNTSLVIDEFVYDPASNSGHMLTKLTQGTLQYIGGQLSHQGAVTIGTPAATIGIRGGIGTFSYGPNGAQAIDLNGVQTIQNGAGTITLITGFMSNILSWNTPPGQPSKIPPELISYHINILSSVNGQTGSGPPFHGLPIAGLTCGTSSTPACPQTPWLPNNTGENNATQILIQSTQLGSQPTPPPPPSPPPCGDCDTFSTNIRTR